MCDINGIISKDSPNLNWMQKKMTEVTNLEGKKGTLADALQGADIFVGVSAPNIVTKEMVASMNKDSILFAMANPVPEIMPDLAKKVVHVSLELDVLTFQIKSIMLSHSLAFQRCSGRTCHTDYGRDETCRC